MTQKPFAAFLQSGMTLGAFCAVMALSACGGPAPAPPTSQTPQGPNVAVTVTSVDQMAQLGSRVSDGGQFVLVGVTLKNQTGGDVKFDPKDFVIRKKNEAAPTGATPPAPGETPATAYEQAQEPDMGNAFTEQFGKEAGLRLLDPNAPVHAGFEVQKILIYNIPKNDALDAWQVRYVPNNTVLALQGEGVKVVDHRVPTTPVEGDEPAEQERR